MPRGKSNSEDEVASRGRTDSGGRFDLGTLFSNTSLSCLTSGLQSSSLLVFIGVHEKPRVEEWGSESWAWMGEHRMPALGEWQGQDGGESATGARYLLCSRGAKLTGVLLAVAISTERNKVVLVYPL